eukprot:SAG31_NODE_61_length_29286_cov_444.645973_8_plen_76_part_00
MLMVLNLVRYVRTWIMVMDPYHHGGMRMVHGACCMVRPYSCTQVHILNMVCHGWTLNLMHSDSRFAFCLTDDSKH